MKLKGKCTFQVLSILPEVPTLVLSVKETTNNGLCCIVRLSVNNKRDALSWLQQFQEKTLTTYTVDGTFKENTQKIVFKVPMP